MPHNTWIPQSTTAKSATLTKVSAREGLFPVKTPFAEQRTKGDEHEENRRANKHMYACNITSFVNDAGDSWVSDDGEARALWGRFT